MYHEGTLKIQEPSLDCKPRERLPIPFLTVQATSPLMQTHYNLAEPSASTYIQKGLPFAIAEFLLLQTGT